MKEIGYLDVFLEQHLALVLSRVFLNFVCVCTRVRVCACVCYICVHMCTYVCEVVSTSVHMCIEAQG